MRYSETKDKAKKEAVSSRGCLRWTEGENYRDRRVKERVCALLCVYVMRE